MTFCSGKKMKQEGTTGIKKLLSPFLILFLWKFNLMFKSAWYCYNPTKNSGIRCLDPVRKVQFATKVDNL